MKSIAFTLNNNSDISHRILSRYYNVDHRTIAKVHYIPQVLHTLEANCIPFVPMGKNPPNVPQVRTIEELEQCFLDKQKKN
ncbi:unnamed protein product [Rotaria sordida]|uniref:Uncharacterized protein n=1 Tax=Rotaria sordida TaxID=392033 RepID=A0A820BBB7_9BILA|nr:unnamed protein product [Rotaria sordida]